MVLWTIQPVEFYNKLLKNGEITCNTELMDNPDFKDSYDWLVEQMNARGITRGNLGADVKYTLWAWHTRYWKHKKPDLRFAEYGAPGTKSVCIEFEIPDNEVLLSDFDAWHYVLNNMYFDDSNNDDEWESIHTWFDNLDSDERHRLKMESWQKIFDIEPFKSEWITKGQFVQATFWKLKLSEVKIVQYFTCR